MNRKTLGTFLTRMVVMISTLGVVLLNTHYLGVSGQGTTSLINFGILLILTLSNFIGGGALVYLIPRMKNGDVVWPSVIWAILSSLIFYLIFLLFPIVPKEYILHTVILGLLQSLSIFIQHISLGREKVSGYNMIIVTQSLSGVFFLFILFYVFHWNDSMAFVTALYISFFITLTYAVIRERDYLFKAKSAGMIDNSREMLRYGKYGQGGNILHLLNQRMNFVFLENLLVQGRVYTGIYSIVLYIGEGIWTVSKSLSLVQYSRIANSESNDDHKTLTEKYLRISIAFVTASCLILLMIPDNFYQMIFSREITGLQQAMWWFIPGIIANSASIIYAHYFSGRGLQHYNAIASALGLTAGTVTALLFIPSMKVSGAAMAISVALVVQMVYFITRYKKESKK